VKKLITRLKLKFSFFHIFLIARFCSPALGKNDTINRYKIYGGGEDTFLKTQKFFLLLLTKTALCMVFFLS